MLRAGHIRATERHDAFDLPAPVFCPGGKHRERIARYGRRCPVTAQSRLLLEESEHASYSAQFRREIEMQAEIRQSEDALEGRNAFVQKRAARFGGR